MATIKTGETRDLVDTLGSQLVGVLHSGGAFSTAPQEVATFSADVAAGGAEAVGAERVRYALTNTQAAQTSTSATSGEDGAVSYTDTYSLAGRNLKNADTANGTTFTHTLARDQRAVDGAETITDTVKSAVSIALNVNPYAPQLLAVTRFSSTSKEHVLLETVDDSRHGTTSTAASASFAGLAQFQGGELQTITVKSYSTASKLAHVGLDWEGAPLNWVVNQTFSLGSKSGLTYTAGTEVMTGVLNTLTYHYTDVRNGQTKEDSYSGTLFSASMMSALAVALPTDGVYTSALKQVLFGGDDIISGTRLNQNWLAGGAGNDRITGNVGDDELYGDEGDDRLFGGAGRDHLYGGDGDDVVFGEAGDDALGGNAGNDRLYGGAGNDEVAGAVGDDLLFGEAGDDALSGGSGNDVLDGGTGVDSMTGDEGDDLYILDSADELVRINIFVTNSPDMPVFYHPDDGNDTLRITYKGGTSQSPALIDMSTTLGEVENVTLTSTGVFSVVGNDQANRFDAGKATATFHGGLGDDTYYVASKGVTVVENDASGTDTVIASLTYALGANVENLTLAGKAALNGTGNALGNVITGNDGANILDGGAGADSLVGGKGNDTYIVDDANDAVVEALNAGTDTVKASASYTLAANVENLLLTGTAQDSFSGTGNALKNSLFGDAGNNHLDGAENADRLFGGKGDDTYTVDLIAKSSGSKATVALEDAIGERKGEGDHDTLVLRISDATQAKLATASKATTLTLATHLENLDASHTGDLQLNLTGNAANNIITGNAAANLIVGGVGADTLTGGDGADTFSFTALKELGLHETQDVITDFTSGVDSLIFKGFKGWSFDAAASQASAAKQLWTQVDGDDLIVYGNSGGTLDADFSIKLVGVGALQGSDIVLG